MAMSDGAPGGAGPGKGSRATPGARRGASIPAKGVLLSAAPLAPPGAPLLFPETERGKEKREQAIPRRKEQGQRSVG